MPTSAWAVVVPTRLRSMHGSRSVSGPDVDHVCTVHWNIYPKPPLHAVVLGSRGGEQWLTINAVEVNAAV